MHPIYRKVTHKKIVFGDVKAAKRVLISQTKNRAEKKAASNAIVIDVFEKSFGRELAELENELRDEKCKKVNWNRNLFNMGVFEDVVTEMEHNPKSPSILLRKIDLEHEQGLFVWERDAADGRSRKKKTTFQVIREE